MNYFAQLLESYDKLKKRQLSIKLDELTAAGEKPVGDYATLLAKNPEGAAEVDQTLMGIFGTADPKGQFSDAGGAPNAPQPDNKETGYGIPPGTVGRVTQGTEGDGQATSFIWYVGLKGASGGDRAILTQNGASNSQKFREFRNALAARYTGSVENPKDKDKPKTKEEKAEDARNKANAKLRKELDRNKSFDRAGGTFEEYRGFRDEGPDGLEGKIVEWVGYGKRLAEDYRTRNIDGDAFWATGSGKDRDSSQAEQAYITGNAGASLERKWALAEGITIDTVPILDGDGKDTGETEPLVTPIVLADEDIGLLRGAGESVNFLFRAALGGDGFERSSECGKLPTYVKKSGSNYVFLGRGEVTQGLVIASNDMLDYAVSRALENCDGASLPQIPKAKYDPQELNDFRGKINEVALTSLHMAGIIERIEDPKKKQEITQKHLKYIAGKLLEDDYKFKAAMQWAKRVASGEVSTDTESQKIYETLKGLEAMTENEDLLKDYFISLARLEQPVIHALQPDLILPVGVNTGQGYADDNVYGYLNESEVQAKVEHFRNACLDMGGIDCDHLSLGYESTTMGELRSQGGEAKNILSHYEAAYKAEGVHKLTDDTPVYTIGSSLKSYLKFGGYKAGENNSYEDRSAVVRGTGGGIVHPEMHRQTQTSLGLDQLDGNGKPTKGTPTYDGVLRYQDKLDSAVKSLETVFPAEDAVRVDKKGNVVVGTWAETGAKAVYKQLKDKFEFLEGQESAVLRLFTDDKGQWLPMTPENHGYISERMTRLITTSKYGVDGNDRDSKGNLTELAINARANAAYTIQMLGGAVGGGFTNVKDLATGTTLVVSHQAPIDGPTRGILENPDEWEFKGSGSSLKITRKGTNQSLSLKTTRKTRSNSYQTGSAVMVSKALAEEYSMINEEVVPPTNPEDGQESIMYKFIMGQKLLLEQLEQELTVN